MQKFYKIFLFSFVLCVCIGAYYYFTPKKITQHEYEQKFNVANQLLMSGNNDQAIAVYKELLTSPYRYPAVYFNYGRALINKQLWQAAIDMFISALDLSIPVAHLAHFQIGVCYKNMGKNDEAIAHFKQAIANKSDYADAYYSVGTIWQEQDNLEAAADYFLKATELDPKYCPALIAVAIALRDMQSFDASIIYFQHAARFDPDNFHIYQALGDVLNMAGDWQKAIAMYQQACALNPECYEAFNNIGTIYAGQRGQLDKAYPYFMQGLKLKPDHGGIRAGLSAFYLVKGDYEKGWQEYEWRLSSYFDANRPTFNKPRWDGVTSLKGKKIVVHAEQGLGDTFQFIRYAQMLKKQGAHIVAAVQKPLVKILSRCAYLDSVIPLNTQLPEHDAHAELMSLPYLCKTRVESIPAPIPYLCADEELVTQWQNNFRDDKSFRIGICWQVEKSHDSDVYRAQGKTLSVGSSKRSIPLELFEQLVQIKNVKLYSLQKNAQEELALLQDKNAIHDFGPELDSKNGAFMDTAAIMKNLDLVITADTSVAHLAGGLGVPVWIMLPFPADWRWLLNRSDSPWYPSMRLFRKKFEHKDWCDVMGEVKVALNKRLGKLS